jgi:hypothetical protein
MSEEETELILDREQLQNMGIHAEEIYTIEYDMSSERKIPKNATPYERKEIKTKNKLAREFRNKLIHALKFKIMASKHLESSWIISKDKLETAVEELENLKADMESKGFKNVDKRLRIIPILTTDEGFEHYEELKAQFLLKFATEHIRYIDNGIDDQRMSPAILWRCKKAFSIIESLKEEVKHRPDLYDEIVDTVALLSDKISIIEEHMRKWKEEREAQKAK